MAALLQRTCSPCLSFSSSVRTPGRARAAVLVRAQSAQQQSAQTRIATVGLAASTLFAAGNVHAATELMQIADSDGRLGILALIALPALGWVAFNIAGPALNQLNAMDNSGSTGKKRGIAAGLGLTAASLLAASGADAAEIARLAESDNRLGIIALLFLPVVGWVGFNILQPALNQLNKMTEEKDTPKGGRRRGVAAGLGLGAAGLLAAPGAEAATELAQLAASDNRAGLLFLVFLPVLGWVAFNILGPAKNQLDKMTGAK